MSGSHIGIKTADGSFYPICAKTAEGRKRLILTTAHDNQQAVHISLYQGDEPGEGSADAEYIGTLVVENLVPAPQGRMEVSLVLGLNDSGNLTATATDVTSGEYQSLSVNLASVDEQSLFSASSFSLEELEEERLGEGSEPDEDSTAAAQQSAAGASGSEALEDDLPVDEALTLEELDDDFSFESGAEQDAAWQETLDSDERRFAAEDGAVGEGGQADSGPRSDEEFDLGLDEEEIDFDFDIEDGEPRLELDGDAAEAPYPADTGQEQPSAVVAGHEPDTQPELVKSVRTGFTADLESQREQSGPGIVMFLGFLLLALAALGFLTYIIFRAIETPDIPPLEAGLLYVPFAGAGRARTHARVCRKRGRLGL
ncbi:MAG: hypothetical protein EA384_08480 [Spirochaetaceae bacterium]|nr:MAG: hypothetical protein EA384_08480 [Spirochaetaceae bacterium]